MPWSGQKISITSRKAQTTRHRITGMRTHRRDAVRLRRHAGLPDPARHRAEPVAQQDRAWARWATSTWSCSWSRPASFTPADAKVLALLKPGIPAAADRQQAGQGAPPRRYRALAARHAAAACVRRVRADVGQERQGHRAAVRHLREIPARAGLVVRPRTSSPTAARSSWPARRCAKSCSASPATSCPTPRRWSIDKFEEEPSPKHSRMVQDRGHHRGRARRPQGDGDRRQGRAAQAHRHRDAPGAREAHGLPRCSSSCGSRCAPAGPTTRRGCAASGTSKRPQSAARIAARDMARRNVELCCANASPTSPPSSCTATTGASPA